MRLKNEVNLFDSEIYKELDLEDHCELVMGRSMLFLVCIYDNKYATPFARGAAHHTLNIVI